MSISAVTIIKNGLKLGYPFVESILSILPVCDEVIISEGYSEDGTLKILQTVFENEPKIRIVHDRWPVRKSGRAIAEITDLAVACAAGDWIFYLQADEILHEKNLDLLRKIDGGDYPFNAVAFDFLHFSGSWHHVNPNPGYTKAIRMFRNGRKIISHHDGWSFCGEVEPVMDCSDAWEPIYHYGWVFRENIPAKRENHAGLYPDNKDYQQAAKNQLPPPVPEPNYFGNHPRVVQHLLNLDKYTPLGIKV
ncbi:MAG: glycosyltransferase [FCB group bacterium]|nr:glycosyltransferase [FCB group bacterium]